MACLERWKGAFSLILAEGGASWQLENLIRRWYAVIPEERILPGHLAAESRPAAYPVDGIDAKIPFQDLKEQAIEVFTREYLCRLLGRAEGNVSAAEQLSGMKRQSLQEIIRRYGIDVQRLRSQFGKEYYDE